jgi:CheY-like chemotaxis protein
MVSSSLNVLIVDDDVATREMLATFLSSHGVHAVAAEDGLEALHLLRSVRRRTPETPCLVLLDLSMPRFGGKEFRRAQLSDPHLSDVPVVIMSGAADLEQRARAMEAVAVLRKPIDLENLMAVVERHCAPAAMDLRLSPNRLSNRGRQYGA